MINTTKKTRTANSVTTTSKNLNLKVEMKWKDWKSG